eukprot:1152540-Pelagomonas_calceolata.AAC.2
MLVLADWRKKPHNTLHAPPLQNTKTIVDLYVCMLCHALTRLLRCAGGQAGFGDGLTTPLTSWVESSVPNATKTTLHVKREGRQSPLLLCAHTLSIICLDTPAEMCGWAGRLWRWPPSLCRIVQCLCNKGAAQTKAQIDANRLHINGQ